MTFEIEVQISSKNKIGYYFQQWLAVNYLRIIF